MAFPFVAPFDPWVKEVLNIRQKNPIIGSMKNPFVIMTSAARVVKTPGQIPMDPNKRVEILKGLLNPTNQKQTTNRYDGCIISNNVNNINLSYSHTSGTPVGIDLNGNIITADDEKDRFVSTPIIESLEIDTDGANNTLKTAKVKVKCFTLKQLEMFEMFFMKPGMNVLVEFGDGALLSGLLKYDEASVRKDKTVFRNGQKKNVKPASRIEECLIPKNSGADNFVDEFVQYFRSGLENSIRYFTKIESSFGTYDLVAGKVINYSFSYQEDGTYDCDIEISQSNQISLALPNNPPKANASNQKPPENAAMEYTSEAQILDSIVLNFNLDKKKLESLLDIPHPETGKAGSTEWIKKEIFNFVKVDETNKDQKASSDAYMSLRFIVKILMNYVLSGPDGDLQKDFFGLSLAKAKIVGNTDNKVIDVIPIKSNKNLISSNTSVIFPSATLPKISVLPAGDNAKIKAEERIVIDPKQVVNATINGYDIHFPAGTNLDVFYKTGNSTNEIIQTRISADDPNQLIGNALNIFIRFEDVVRMWNQELFRIDFLAKVLNLINKQSYGLFQLIYAASDDSTSAVPTIIDTKFVTNDSLINSLNEEPFRFKIGPKDSIITNFSFNFEMSNLMAAQSIYGNTKLLYEAARSSSVQDNGSLVPPDTMYRSFDKSSMANADGWWSINYVDYKVSLAKLKDAKNKYDQLDESTKNAGIGDKPTEENAEEQKSVTSNESETMELIKGNQVNFQSNGKGSQHIPLIYTDYTFIYRKIYGDVEQKNNVTLSPVDVSFTVDGFSGFRCGYFFLIDGIPEIYNKNGRFQITNVKHSVQPDGWTTTVEAGYLPKPVKITKSSV